MPPRLNRSFSSKSTPHICCLFVSNARVASKEIVAKRNPFYARAPQFEDMRVVA